MNKGIDFASGEWLYFLGADDKLFKKDTLSKVNRLLNNQVDLVSGKIKYDFCNKDSRFLKKNDGVFRTKWSSKMWIKNTVHHQSVFYKKQIFDTNRYQLSYEILADYQFNLSLFKKGLKHTSINEIVAICGTEGISKKHQWKLYKEEIGFKTRASSKLLKPVFFTLAVFKYLLK